MSDDQNRTGSTDDDLYVIEDDGASVEEIEQEMQAAAQEATADQETPPADDAAPPADAEQGAAPAGEESVRQENRQLKDRYLRTLADFENFRKRSEREKNDYFRYALSGVVKDLLPVLDNFDRALEHAEEGDEFHKGVLLIYKQLFDVLEKHGLKPIDESGVQFDPNIHEAVVREENADVPSHTVVAILQKGYFLYDRLLRPALVKVAVGGAEE